jgi:hypothetical protein
MKYVICKHEIYPAFYIDVEFNEEGEAKKITLDLTAEQVEAIQSADKEWEKWQDFLHKEIYGY